MRYLPALLWAAAIFYLSHQPKLPDSPVWFEGVDKIAHAGVYAVLAGLLLYGARFPTDWRAWVLAAVAAVYGLTDEFHQSFVPNRSADVLDLLADWAGAVLAAAGWLAWSKRRTQEQT